MAGKNEKWVLFRNYLHNELGITKEDIREWLEEAIQQQAKEMVAQSFSKFSIQDRISEIVEKRNWFHGTHFKDEVIKETAKILAERVELQLKK